MAAMAYITKCNIIMLLKSVITATKTY